LRTAGLKDFHEICCSWDVTEIDAHKNTQNLTKVGDTSHEDLYVYRRVSGERLGKY